MGILVILLVTDVIQNLNSVLTLQMGEYRTTKCFVQNNLAIT